MTWVTPLLLTLSVQPSSTMLQDYVDQQDPAFAYQVESRDGRQEFSLTSQNWQGEPWTHDLFVVEPSEISHEDSALLFITGDRSDNREVALAQQLADTAGVPVAVLYDVPNQPLYDRKEDALIAYTFQKYLETGDETWPLLFPMTKSVVAAMDALEESQGYERFVLAGASKRGWTSWLAAASGDERVTGIAPLVIDNLNIPLQMQRQQEYWQGYSEEIGDYTELGLQEMIQSPEMQPLVEAVDPYFYLDQLNLPKLMINGANDPYWTVDALAPVWPDISNPKNVVVVPNAGHGVEDYDFWLPTVAEFVDATFAGRVLPQVEISFNQASPAAVQASWQNVPGIQRVSVWRATSPDLRFADKQWEVVGTISPEGFGRQVVAGPVAYDQNNAYFAEIRIDDGEGGYYRITSPVRLFRRS